MALHGGGVDIEYRKGRFCKIQRKQDFAIEREIHTLRILAVGILLVLALAVVSQQVYAENTYQITDGTRVLIHTTRETDPEDVLAEAGLTLDADDTYTTHSGDGVSRIQVRRNHTVTIDYYGRIIQVDSLGETVEQLLNRLELPREPEDYLSSDPESQTYDGMRLELARVVCQEQAYTQMLPWETIYCFDAGLPEGTRQVLTQGRLGEVLCRAEVTYKNGVEVHRRIIHQQVTKQPVRQVMAIGTGGDPMTEQAMPAMQIGKGRITLPTGEVLTYTDTMFAGATAYTCEGYRGITATGTVARVGAIAVDPKVIPYGTRMFIVTNDGQYVYGIATAEDCGSKYHIFGNRIDLYFDTLAECIQFGYRECTIYFLG